MSDDVTPTPTPPLTSAPAPVPTAPLPDAPAPWADLPHDSRQANIMICGALCFGIASVFVALRIYTRGWIIRALGPSDWSIVIALLFSAGTTAVLIEQAALGSGRHVWDLDPTDISSGMRWGRSAWMGVLFYLLTIFFAKSSILLLYIHIFAFKWARTAGQYLLGIVVITHVYMLVMIFTACIPLQSFWDWTVDKKYCHPPGVWWANTGLHMVTDFFIFLIPMPVVWSITLPKKQKLMLFLVFGFGFIVCFISILRLLQLLYSQNPAHPVKDFTWAAIELSYLTAVEINGAIVVACVMTLKPFFVRHFPALIISGRSSNSTSTTNGLGSGSRSGRQQQGRRGSENVMGRPPTIGSRPTKGPLSPVSQITVDSELLASKPRGSLQLAAAAAAQVWRTTTGGDGNISDNGNGNRENRNSAGYMELDDSWVVDVEMAEGIGAAKQKSKFGEGGDESDITAVETDKGRGKAKSGLKADTETGMGKKNSTRSNDSEVSTLRPIDADTITTIPDPGGSGLKK
ncbi:hypothetical protein V8F20_007829 [Naviculisporaceae sp. PSN 640]